MTKPPPAQRRPGVSSSHAVIDQAVRIYRGQKPPIQSGEPVGLGLLPDPPFSLDARQIPQPFLRRLLGPRPKAVTHVVARNDQVASVGSSPPHQDMGVRLVGVEVAGRHPA
ncbi:hypothetical protein D3C75_918070 [compost metagenome]